MIAECNLFHFIFLFFEGREAYRGPAVTVILTKEQLPLNRKNRDVSQVLALGERETQRENRSGSRSLGESASKQTSPKLLYLLMKFHE